MLPSRFPVGTPVRVKPGTVDPDFPGICLNDWAGTVQAVDAPTCLVRWNQATLARMSPTYLELCENEDLEMESMWLDETDLELDESAAVDSKSSSAETALVPCGNGASIKKGQALEDHSQWFTGAQTDEAFEFFSDIRSHLPRRRMSFTRALTLVLGGGAVLGVVLGSLFGALELTRYLAGCGAALLGLLGLVSGARLGRVIGRLNRGKSAAAWGSVLGFVTGGLLGALLGAILTAVAGVLLGAIVGALAAKLTLRGSKRALLSSVGAVAGATVQAFLVDEEQALSGAVYGGLIGAGAAFLAVVGAKIIVTRHGRA
jgi:hypothetical protein